ncbi:maltodextrin glucosidase [Endozoicomonas montiporae]|uniref:Maltodextrin glucosidase n=2 Tax=Endozoicomonas montiporae TaxID=1027273 RepID=A0A081N9N8_9GAMM|nr:maltodextrin glucosidase [Endozoicomonas montiporae]AMO55014.1 maltodextrin glucosidase [Endozoicomonas montiporae CL-33]KEQ15161.1 maltodextrin glucosidase [Endozoicomonas montiporae]
MNQPFLFHGQDAFWVEQIPDALRVTVAIKAELAVEHLYIRCEPDNEEELIAMKPGDRKNRLRYWHGELPLNHDKDLTAYCFKLLTRNQQWWLSGSGVTERVPGREFHFKFNRCHQPPDWFSQQVFYQIFPDRFNNGDPSISVRAGEYCLKGSERPTVVKDWGEPVAGHGSSGASEFYGGDLRGIENKLDYLEQLGVTALYLNPIFKAPSNHKYDTTDYLTIDPHLGTNEQFAVMVNKLHQRGMRIILDAVFNHTSVDHSWFDKYQRNDSMQRKGAFGHPDSPYRHYYQFDGDSDTYISWKGIDSLPKLNFSNPEVQNFIYAGDEAVIKHWLKPPYTIDGWRFDVIHMLGEGVGAKNNAHYVQAFRQAAKSVNPNSFVLGEHFFEASSWLQGEQEDGAMNYYGFGHPVRAFLAGQDISYHPCQIDAATFAQWLDEARSKIPWLNQLSQLNQLDSHDTARFLTLLNNDQALMQQALIMLFAYVGTPCLYYGTEVALEGGQDPDCRRCFPWERVEANHPMLGFVQQLIAVRKEEAALQTGSFQWLHALGRQLAFARSFGDDRVICVLNADKQPVSLDLPVWQLGIEAGQADDLLAGDNLIVRSGMLTINLLAKEGKLLKLAAK